MKVLIADDDPVSLLYLHNALEDSGYEVVSASDGENAYEILRQSDAPMLAILDWMMPKMDGVNICRKIRETVKDRYIYLIILTSGQETEFVVEAINAGADDFISKPYSVEELQARLRTGRRISELEQELRLKATHDSLTGLYNRGAITDILRNATARQERYASPISIMFADLDHFKQTNDNYGHQAGDAVLREVARRVTRLLRPYDSFGRFGGEEFLIVLPECGSSGALAVAERVRAASYHSTSGSTSTYLSNPKNYILWYAKNTERTKFRKLLVQRGFSIDDPGPWQTIEKQMVRQRLGDFICAGGSISDPNLRIVRLGDATSQRQGREAGDSSAMGFPFVFQGKTFRPSGTRGWSTTEAGLVRAAKAARLYGGGQSLSIIRYFDESPYFPLNSSWEDTGGTIGADKVYVVQSNVRC